MESCRSKEGGLLCRHERLDTLLLVQRFTEQPAQAKRRVRQGGHLALRDQPLVGLTDRGQEVPTGGSDRWPCRACDHRLCPSEDAGTVSPSRRGGRTRPASDRGWGTRAGLTGAGSSDAWPRPGCQTSCARGDGRRSRVRGARVRGRPPRVPRVAAAGKWKRRPHPAVVRRRDRDGVAEWVGTGPESSYWIKDSSGCRGIPQFREAMSVTRATQGVQRFASSAGPSSWL